MSFTKKEKADFHRKWISRMKKLAKLLGMKPGTFDVRSNKGGTAVLGEVTLHGEKIYIQVSDYNQGVLVRTCNGRKDYCGGRNNYISLASLAAVFQNPETEAAALTLWEIKKIMEKPHVPFP